MIDFYKKKRIKFYDGCKLFGNLFLIFDNIYDVCNGKLLLLLIMFPNRKSASASEAY